MKLHRTTGSPDWSGLTPEAMNSYQRLAAATRGVITPANAATMIGFATVLYGLYALLQREYWTAVTLLSMGRLLDVVDGWLADTTSAKSPLGELLDASVDKLITLLCFITLFLAQIAPWWLLGALIAPQFWAAAVTVLYRARSIHLQPSAAGKFSMAALWVCLIGFIVNAALGTLRPLEAILYIIAAGSIISGCQAAAAYTLNWRQSPPK